MNRWIELAGTFRRSEQASAAAPHKKEAARCCRYREALLPRPLVLSSVPAPRKREGGGGGNRFENGFPPPPQTPPLPS